MKYIILLTGLLGTSPWAQADEVYENGLFTEPAKMQNFDSQIKLEAYIKSNMPSTYRYFERLTAMSKKRVFQQHQENKSKDITEIVLVEYRNRS